jgi:hypothetical protein
MYDNFKEGECGANGIGPDSERWGCCKEAVHNIVWVGSKADEKKQFRTLLDCTDSTFYGVC